MEKHGTSFDGISDTFEENIYGRIKGRIRLHVLQNDLLQSFPALTRGGLRILDAAGGEGIMSRFAAGYGNQIELVDLSEEMITKAEDKNRECGLSGLIYCRTMPLQHLKADESGTFDAVFFHGAIGWISTQEEALKVLSGMLKPGGMLSLLFFNRDKLIFKYGTLGKLEAIQNGIFTGPRKQLTPSHPLSCRTVQTWLDELGYEMISKAGVRIFCFFREFETGFRQDVQRALDTELYYSRIEPYAGMGDHIHICAEKRCGMNEKPGEQDDVVPPGS